MPEETSGQSPDQDPPAPDDALMAVLLGAPAPADPVDRAAYDTAARDMAVLRAQLHRIGRDLSHDPGRPPAPAPRRPRARRWLLALAASLALLVGAGAGVSYLAAVPPGGGDAKLTEEGLVACSRLIAEGTVTDLQSLGPRVRVVLEVERYLKPGRGPAETAFTVDHDEAGAFSEGSRVLVQVSRFPREPVHSTTGEEIAGEWERLSALLPGARGARCDHPG